MKKALLFITLSLLGCHKNPNKSLLKITSGSLVYEVNHKMKTKVSSGFSNSKVLMTTFQASETLEIEEGTIVDFTLQKVYKSYGSNQKFKGDQWILEGVHQSEGLNIKKILSLQTFEDFPDLISTQVTYVNNSSKVLVLENWSNNAYTIPSQNDSPPFWVFQGSSSSRRDDWIKPLDTIYYQKNYMGMNDTDYGGGIPITSIWRRDINISVGHLEKTPKRINLPTSFEPNTLLGKVAVEKEYSERKLIGIGDSLNTLETFISLGNGDYYGSLAKYSKLMQSKGIQMEAREETAFDPIWCSWGYGKNFTSEDIMATLPKVKELGIKWVVLDDGYQIAEGDWRPKPEKFANGDGDLKRLVEKIHSYGLKAKIWWTPLAADPNSEILKRFPDSKVLRKDGSPQYINWWDSYYLSPTKKVTIDHTKATLKLFLDEWGFDGLKMDGQHLNSVAPDHSLDNPEESFESLPDYFQMIYDEAQYLKPGAVVENCPCGTCMSYFNMASINQTVSSDPLTSWQIRHKGKAYKALAPKTAYYGDHVELSDNGNDFASSFGIGAVLGTKFTIPRDDHSSLKDNLLTPEKEKIWKKWFGLYNKLMLSKGEYLGGLYDLGYDKPETHVIQKDGRIYYAFYADDWSGEIKLKGLRPNKNYTLYSYLNDMVLGKVKGKNASYQVSFKNFLLLVATPE